MTPTSEKDLIRRFTEAWNDRDRETMGELYADRVEVSSGETLTCEELLDAEAETHAAFPDITAEIDELLAEGGRVLVRWTCTGTHEGEIAGIEPTGTEVEYEEWAVYTVEDDHLVAVDAQQDGLSLLSQLGAIEWPPEEG